MAEVPHADRDGSEVWQDTDGEAPYDDLVLWEFAPASAADRDGSEYAAQVARARATSAAACEATWPDCVSGDYNPACCRWPKSCSYRPAVDPPPFVPDMRGFALWLNREQWGVIVDALIQHRAHAEVRKAGNSESTSDARADMCRDLIGSINKRAMPEPTEPPC